MSPQTIQHPALSFSLLYINVCSEIQQRYDNQDDCSDKMTAEVKLNFTSTELTLITDRSSVDRAFDAICESTCMLVNSATNQVMLGPKLYIWALSFRKAVQQQI